MLQAPIPSPDVNPDTFGNSVSLSQDGNTALIGAMYATVNGKVYQGAAYILTRTGTVWSAPTKLVAPDGVVNDLFGDQVALSGDGATALIAAPQNQSDRGSVYISNRTGNNWSAPVKLVAADGLAGDFFGASVALSDDGTTAAIGANGVMVNGYPNEGVVYVFTRAGGVYSLQTRLVPLVMVPTFSLPEFGRGWLQWRQWITRLDSNLVIQLV